MSTREDRLAMALGGARDLILGIRSRTWALDAPDIDTEAQAAAMNRSLDEQVKIIAAALEVPEIEPAANEHCPGTLALADGGLTLRLFEGHKLVGEHHGRRYAPAAGAVLVEDNGAQWQVTDAPLTMALQGANVVSVSVVNVVNVTVTKIAWEF